MLRSRTSTCVRTCEAMRHTRRARRIEGTKDRHPIFGPAFCAALDGGDWGTKKGKKGA